MEDNMHTNDSHSFGSYLREKREAAGLSGAQLAQRAGISAGFLNRVERGERHTLAPDMLQHIVDELELDPAEAFAFVGIKPAAVMPSKRAFFRSVYGVSEAEADEIIEQLEMYLKERDKGGSDDNGNQKADD
jgi:transcriptional regulator with XRE-family HTH domain